MKTSINRDWFFRKLKTIKHQIETIGKKGQTNLIVGRKREEKKRKSEKVIQRRRESVCELLRWFPKMRMKETIEIGTYRSKQQELFYFELVRLHYWPTVAVCFWFWGCTDFFWFCFVLIDFVCWLSIVWFVCGWRKTKKKSIKCIQEPGNIKRKQSGLEGYRERNGGTNKNRKSLSFVKLKSCSFDASCFSLAGEKSFVWEAREN